MRRIGSLSDERQARRFQDYLFTRDVEARVDQADDGWNVWVLDEDCLDKARQELAEFEQDPDAEKYVSASTRAEERRQARLREQLDAGKRQIDMRERWERPLHERIRVTILLIVGSLGVTVATEFGANREVTNHVYIEHVDFATEMYNITLQDVRSGELWRLVTPIFLHMDFLHIAFNMYILFVFGGLIEDVKGKWRFMAMVLAIAVVSNLAQYWGPVYRFATWSQLFDDPDRLFSHGPTFGGMSGVNFGLFGYLWMKSKFSPAEGFHMPMYIVVQFLAWTLLCLSGLIGPIANTAHIIGLLVGMVIALTPVMYQRVSGR